MGAGVDAMLAAAGDEGDEFGEVPGERNAGLLEDLLASCRKGTTGVETLTTGYVMTIRKTPDDQ